MPDPDESRSFVERLRAALGVEVEPAEPASTDELGGARGAPAPDDRRAVVEDDTGE